jgi:dihydropteroate synthase
VTATDGDALAAIREVADPEQVVTVARTGGEAVPDEPDVRVRYGGRVDHVEAAVTVEGGDPDRPDDEAGGGDHEDRSDLLGADWRVAARIPTPGAHQAENAGVATALARAVLGDDRVPIAVDPDFDLVVEPGTVPTPVVARGLRRARWPGRFEALSTDPLVVLDGAHNPGACERLTETVAEYDVDDVHLVLGALVDKDHAGMVEALPEAAAVYPCRPPVGRAETATALAGVVERVHGGAVEPPTDGTTVAAAVDRALAAADPEDCVLVTGSQYVVREARRRWSGADRRPRVLDRADADRVAEDAALDAADRVVAAEEALTRTVRLRLAPERADGLARTARAVGASCRVSPVGGDAEPREVVLSGSHRAYRRLVDELGETDGAATVERRLRRVLADDLDAPAGDSPPDRPLGPPPVPGEVTGGDEAVARSPVTVETGGRGPVADDRLPWLTGDTPAVMGIINVTPDSFHDGGEYDAVAAAVERAEEMAAAGVGVLDVGGESTRPGADPVAVRREIKRVRPVVEGIREAGIDLPVSVDTRKAPVARAALEAGADVINDVSGLEDPDLPRVAAAYDAGLVVMHSLAAPVDPDREAEYDDVVSETLAWLRERVLFAERVGVDRDRIVVDPGLGFGKSAAESFELLDRVGEFRALGCPVLVGHSHKSMFGLAGYDDGERLPPTVAATALAVDRGADLVRVHDPVENVAALRTALTTGQAGEGDG